ncbi:hypothetical protein QQS21_002960 [Conoideocrella luteorostrata]|uniref:Uncharacterized protein n=1 Tax=Conoideocrella luteorostrata TaxID=1105319 RepID=A0AAJ0CV23_9HYPO|nr:hypothetical protein QQS21_002960 [Conoideocrella luteorostrata]
MRSFPFGALLLAGSVAALPRQACLSAHSQALAEYTDCADRKAVSYCLSTLSSFETGDIKACYADAGCSARQAAADAEYIINRCNDISQGAELRRRYRAEIPHVEATTTMAAAELKARATNQVKTGNDCFSFGTTTVTACLTEVNNGKLKTLTCTPSPVQTSDCLDGWICTANTDRQQVCMLATNSLDIGGIIIAIVFGSFIVIGIGYLTFACCRERKNHKKVAAKAEAVALARAATKKKRAQESRAPLMQQTQDIGNGPNPFQDQPGHS